MRGVQSPIPSESKTVTTTKIPSKWRPAAAAIFAGLTVSHVSFAEDENAAQANRASGRPARLARLFPPGGIELTPRILSAANLGTRSSSLFNETKYG
jgi:hypothetical protein